MLSLRRFQTFLQCSQQALIWKFPFIYTYPLPSDWFLGILFIVSLSLNRRKKKREKKKKNLFFSPQSPKSWSASTFSLASNASLLCSLFLIFMLDNTWLARSENAWWKKKMESVNWMFLFKLRTPHSQLKPGNKYSRRKCPAITNNSTQVATIIQPLLTLSGTHILPFNCNWNVARPWKVWVRD